VDVIRRECNTKGEKRNAHWWESQKERVALGRPRRKWVDNIKMDLRDIGWGGIDWIDLAQDRDQCGDLVNTTMNFRVPLNVEIFLSG
jgi:hypothetical protein